MPDFNAIKYADSVLMCISIDPFYADAIPMAISYSGKFGRYFAGQHITKPMVSESLAKDVTLNVVTLILGDEIFN